MKKKGLLIAALAAAVVVASPLAANVANAEEAGSTGTWKVDGTGWWYEFNDGTYAKDGVYTAEDGETHYNFSEAGYMTVGWYFNPNDERTGGLWYYSNPSGVVQSGWQNIDGTWYYFNEDYYYMYSNGARRVYANDEDTTGTLYYFKPNGGMVSGWYNYDPASTYGDWVYCNSDGSAYDGWLSYNGSWYYLDEGEMLTSQSITKIQKADGSTGYVTYYVDDESENPVALEHYYLGRDGKMIDGWYYTEYSDAVGSKSNSWKYATNGVVKKGWVLSGSKWYYTNREGTMVRDGKAYVGNSKDEPKAPTYPSYSDYKKADGYVDWDAYDAAVDAYNDAYKKYQKDRKAYRLANTYIFDASGAMVAGGWYGSTNTYGTTWYYANANGTAYDGWVQSKGSWYYISEGVMLTNTMTPDGYYVNANGVWK